MRPSRQEKAGAEFAAAKALFPGLIVSFGTACLFLIASNIYGEVLLRVNKEEVVRHIADIDRETWVASDSGTYRFFRGKQQYVLENQKSYFVAEVNFTTEDQVPVDADRQIWIGTIEGVFKVIAFDPIETQRILVRTVGKNPVRFIESSEGSVWVGSLGGLFRAGSDGLAQLEFDARADSYGVFNSGQIWVSTWTNVYIRDASGAFTPAFDRDNTILVDRLVETSGTKYIVTMRVSGLYGPLYRLVDGRAEEVEALQGYYVISVAEVDGVTWFGTDKGVFRLLDGKPKKVGSISEPVNTIQVLPSQQVWVGTPSGPYRWLKSGFTRVAPRQMIDVKGFTSVGDHVWLWAQEGAYRFDEEVEIVAKFNTVDFLCTSFVFDGNLEVDVRYSDEKGENPYEHYDPPAPGQFCGVLETLGDGSSRSLRGGDCRPIAELQRDLEFGYHRLMIEGRDGFGNSSDKTGIRIVSTHIGLGKTIIAVVSVLLLLAVIGCAVVILAPWCDFCLRVICDESLRLARPFTAVYVVLWLGFFRRHLLHRYIQSLIVSRSYSGWDSQRSTAVPSADWLAIRQERLLVQLCERAESRNVFIRYFMWEFARACAVRGGLRRCFVPIAVNLNDVGRVSDIAEKINAELGEVGLRDPSLNQKTLLDGGFIFFLSGFDGDDLEMRQAVEAFCEKYCTESSCVVFSDKSANLLANFAFR